MQTMLVIARMKKMAYITAQDALSATRRFDLARVRVVSGVRACLFFGRLYGCLWHGWWANGGCATCTNGAIGAPVPIENGCLWSIGNRFMQPYVGCDVGVRG